MRKGEVQTTIMGLGISLVMLFVVLFMISKVSTVTAINNTSSFYTTYTSLITNTGTVYDILILVLIVVGLAVALFYLSNFGNMGVRGQAGAA